MPLFSSSVQTVQFSRSIVSDSLEPHGLQHARLPCPSPTPRACSNSCPLSRWCHPTISSSVVPFSSCLQSFPASGSFPVSQFFISGGQSIGVSASASVLPMNIQDWFLEEISSLSHSIVFLYFFALITEAGLLISPCSSLELCVQMGISFLFSFAFIFSSFSAVILSLLKKFLKRVKLLITGPNSQETVWTFI